MTKEEALQYIKKHAEPFGLTYECQTTFNSFCTSMEDLGAILDYHKEAEDALYEWDI